MQRCLELAKQAKSNGHTAVGCVIVKDNTIIAEGLEGSEELPKLMSHAENVAILKTINTLGTKDLSNCALYTTVEPCFMCTYLIRQTKLKKVVYGTTTPAGGNSSIFPILQTDMISVWEKAPEIIGGLLESECKALLKKQS